MCHYCACTRRMSGFSHVRVFVDPLSQKEKPELWSQKEKPWPGRPPNMAKGPSRTFIIPAI